jgi:UDP-glucose 4-epimerase
MSVLVTGGTGFIGGYVVDRLRVGGESVVSYGRTPAAAPPPAEVIAVQGELLDVGRLSRAIVDHDVRGIVHAAGVAAPQLLEAARIAGFGGRIVLLSAVDGSEPELEALDVVSLRFGDVYGPGRRLPDALEAIVAAALTGRRLRLRADADPPQRLLHVEDAARAVVAALGTASPAVRSFDIAGEPVRLEQVVAIVRDRVPTADIRIDGRLPAVEPAAPITVTDADRELHYRPRWGLARGIDDLLTWRELEEAC